MRIRGTWTVVRVWLWNPAEAVAAPQSTELYVCIVLHMHISRVSTHDLIQHFISESFHSNPEAT